MIFFLWSAVTFHSNFVQFLKATVGAMSPVETVRYAAAT